MRLAGYQPQYFPRLHYFARILDADIFTISDHIQFVKSHAFPAVDGKHIRGKSYQADTPIKVSTGVHYLTVPITHQGLLPINQTHISYSVDWVGNHLRSIALHYARTPYKDVMIGQLEQLLSTHYPTIAELNTATILWALFWILGAGGDAPHKPSLRAVNDLLSRPHPFRLRRIVVKSESGIAPPGEGRDATDWIIETCRVFGADEYYCGGTALGTYLDATRFQKAGIRLVQQYWVCQSYQQRFPHQGFVPNLSILDLLANEGCERACQVLQG